jgi:hypothetical protein
MLTETTDVTPDEQPTEDAAPGSGKEAGKETGKGLTFSQEQFDRLMGDRAKRAEDTTRKKLLEELGVANPDELKALVAAEKKRKDNELTELQKANRKLSDTQGDLASAAAIRDELIIENAVIRAAMVYDPPVPSDRIPALLKLIDHNTLSIDDEIVKGATEAIKAALEANPFLLFTDGKGGAVLGTPTPKGSKGVPKPTAKGAAPGEGERTKYPPP